MERYRLMLGLVVCVMLTTAGQVYAQPQYMVTDLGAIQPTAVIDGPVVFGNLNHAPVVWQSGQVFPLQHYGHGGQVNGANARGDSVGFVWLPGSDGRLRRVGAFWYPTGELVLLPGRGETEARGVNMSRIAVGVDWTQRLGLRWRPGAAEEYLRGMSGGSAWAVDAVGRAWGSTGNVAAVWDVNGQFADFIAQHGVQAGVRSANDTTGAGFAPALQGSSLDAAHFNLPQRITRLPRREGAGWSCMARGINNQHATVGLCYRIPNSAMSFAKLWPNTTTQIDLSALTGRQLEQATGISDDGHIVGTTGGRGWLLQTSSRFP
jgi:hypothetical protein